MADLLTPDEVLDLRAGDRIHVRRFGAKRALPAVVVSRARQRGTAIVVRYAPLLPDAKLGIEAVATTYGGVGSDVIKRAPRP